MSLIPTNSRIVHNADGSITVTTTATNSAASTDKTLAQLAPGLQVGNTYKLSMNTTGTNKYIHLNGIGVSWNNGDSKTITQNMLNAYVLLYASGVSTTATIYDIQITEENPEMPFTTLVPAGYTPVEWIASNGNQWIDTGVTDSNRAVFTMSATAESSDMIKFIISNIDSSNFQYGFGLYHSNVSGFSGIDMTEKHNYNIIYSSTGISLVYDGEDKGSTTGYHVDDNKKIVLFGGDFASRRISAKLYNIRLYNNDEMVFDGIPAKQGNNVGLYDTVSHTFKQSLGTLAFTAGPDINNIIYVPQNQ